VLSNLCFAGFITVGALWLRARERRPVDVGLWIIFVTVFPYSLFFSAVYSEALHALLAAGVLLALAQGRLWPAALLAAFLSATRPTGVLMAPAIALAGLWQMRALFRRPLPWPGIGEGLARLAPAVAVAPLGLFLYMGWQYLAIGDALAFSHVQIDWGRTWRGPVAWLRLGFANRDLWVLGDLMGRTSTTLNAGAGVLGLLAALWLALRRHFAAAWYCGAATLLALSSGLNSLPRIVATNPAFLFAAFDLAARLRRPAAIAGLFGLLAALQIVFVVAWFLGAPGLL
jgi:hypothetical protein